jgi:hypothetical protein
MKSSDSCSGGWGVASSPVPRRDWEVSRRSSREQRSRTAALSSASIFGLLILSALPVQADVATLYASTIPNPGGAWRDWTEATGDPGCAACTCTSTTQQYAWNGNQSQVPPLDGDSTRLRVTNFPTFTLPAGYQITKVNVDAMMRYDDTTLNGTVRVAKYISGASLNPVQANFDSTDGVCRYRFGVEGDFPTPAQGWTAALVNSIEAEFYRVTVPGTNTLRISAVRLQVTYVPIDTDGDGTPDINDCAPTNPSIATPRTFFRDLDADGFGNPNDSVILCQSTPPAGYVSASGDCNDQNSYINPSTIWYLDADGDGHGDPALPSQPQCLQPTGYVISNDDQCPTDPLKWQAGACGCETPDTDINGNGLADCNESTSILRTVWSTSVPDVLNWTNESYAESATAPTCGEACNCDSGGTYAFTTSTDWLVATNFASMNIPSGYTGTNVRIDVQCRADVPTNCTIRVQASTGGFQTYLAETTFSSADGQCRYRLGRRGYMESTPPGGWTASALEGIRVQVSRPGGAANTLRVKSFRVRALLVDRDTDHDGLTDTVDPCPTIANTGPDCNGNGLSDVCEIAIGSNRDVNNDGILDTCQNVVGWIGGSTGNFSTATSWSSGVVPGSATQLYLGTTAGTSLTLSTSALTTVASLNVTGGIVRLNMGANFVVTGNVTVAPGATLILDGVAAARYFDFGGASRLQIGSKLEIGGLASVRGQGTASFTSDALTTINLTMRANGTKPLSIPGNATFANGIVLKLGSLTSTDLAVGSRFTLIEAGNLQSLFFQSLGGQSTIDGKFLKSVGTGTFVPGSLMVEVALQSAFVAQAGASSQPLGAATVPSAIVARNFTAGFDGFDDVAVTARKFGGTGVEGPGGLFVFKSSGDANNTFSDWIEYPTDVGPVAVESEDLDSDGDFDIAVLNTVSGSLQIFRNGPPTGGLPADSIRRFSTGPTEPDRLVVSSGDDYLAIARNVVPIESFQLVNTLSMLVAHSGTSGGSSTPSYRAIVFNGATPTKGNPIPVPPTVGPPGPCSPLDDTSRTDGAYVGTFRQTTAQDSGFIGTVHIIAGAGGLPEAQIVTTVPGPNYPIDVEVGNLNLDGFKDVLVAGVSDPATNANPSIAVYAGVSVGGFDLPGLIPLPEQKRPLDLTIGAFDSDTKNDFLVALGTSSGGTEQGDYARLYQNVVGVAGESPAFESSSGDNLFAGAGVRRLRRANLNNVGADDVAVMGETVGGTPSLLPIGSAYGGSKLLQVSSLPPQCVADISGDRIVDGNDLAQMLGSWGGTGVADLDGDDVVGGGDLAILLGAWGACP